MSTKPTSAITHDQMVAIDWKDPKDVISHGFTVTQMAAVHTRLLAELDQMHPSLKQQWINVFLRNDDDAATTSDETPAATQMALISDWIARGLLTGVKHGKLFCRRCRSEGHTKTYCTAVIAEVHDRSGAPPKAQVDSDEPAATGSGPANCAQKFLLHMQSLERQKLIAEKLKSDKRGGNPAGASSQPAPRPNAAGRFGGGGGGGVGFSREAASGAFGSDERRRGVVTRLELDRGVGFLNVQECGEVRFFLDRTDYGLKDPAVGDSVTLKLDLGRDLPAAVEVRPDKMQLTASDITAFLDKCQSSTAPMKLIQTLLMHRHDWPFLVQTVAADASTPDRLESAVRALNALAAMVTFVGNREPVHLVVVKHFLHLMATPVPSSPVLPPDGAAVKREGPPNGDAPPSVSLFPDLLASVLVERHLRDEVCEEPRHVDSLVELATLVMMYRQLSDTPEHVIAVLSAPLENVLTRVQAHCSPTNRLVLKKVSLAIAKMSGSAALIQSLRSAVFPTAAELSLPPTLPGSPFHPANLPVNVTTRYASSEELISAQCKLLRADTFEASCRALAATCYTAPGVARTEADVKEAEHVRVMHNVTFCGRVPTRDRDFSNANGYIFRGESRPGNKHSSFQWHFQTGACVCFTTGQARTHIEEGELFWGVVTSADDLLTTAGMIVVAPCEGSNFSRLISNLARNEAAAPNGAERSLMLEVPLFLAGYQGVVSALLTFVGPASMSLPMTRTIVDEEAPPRTTQRSPAVGYIPPHARYAFDRLVEDVRKSYRLDPGQDEAMRRLSNQELLAIQGPPGTGKSFIGARIVEVYIRFKQLMASGDILNTVDIDALPSARWEKVAPKMGPVVVITYKNHALDEFLIDLLRSGLWNEERQRVVQTSGGGTKTDIFPRGRRIVRVGGRSREPQLADSNLNSLLASRGDRQVVNSFRERVYLMNARLERLAKEIQLLEKGKVPKSYFDRWLTEDQKGSIRYEDRESWLAGNNYTGKLSDPVDPQLYLVMLTSKIAANISKASVSDATAGAPTLASRSVEHEPDDDDDIQLSVFQEMRRESASEREYNNNLRNLYLSAESLALAECPPVRPAGVPDDLMSLWSLSPRTRHEYYVFLIRCSIAGKVKDWLRIMDSLQNIIILRNHAIEEAKLDLLQGADVIGFTTTGCAMNQSLLRSLRPSVLVVEEAAEVLEAQLLACMTDSLQQIVLIGDHYQLKPKVDTFLYEKVNHLNVSMFERLAARMKPIRLVEQRRMHPHISALVRPFYDGQPIEDHESVLTRSFIDASGHLHKSSNIPGLGDTNLFLWDHQHPEEKAPHSLSKINRLELVMCVRLVEHLLSEGVHARSITVITPYLGQCRALRNAFRLRTSHQLRDVRVSTVDLFQGDENDIVILSMVRTSVLTEFLRMRNRMIVACSRARFAYIIVGNSKLLEQSPHWAEVLAMLRSRSAISTHLPVMFGDRKVLVKNSEWPGKRDIEILPSHHDARILHQQKRARHAESPSPIGGGTAPPQSNEDDDGSVLDIVAGVA